MSQNIKFLIILLIILQLNYKVSANKNCTKSIVQKLKKFAGNIGASLFKIIFPIIMDNNNSNRTQSAGVYGTLNCEGKPAVGVKIKLFDVDRWFEPNDLLASGWTDRNGSFVLRGFTREATKIAPMFSIYHDCQDPAPCQRKISITLPEKFVSEGEIPKEFYDAGTIELSNTFPGERRDCLQSLLQ